MRFLVDQAVSWKVAHELCEAGHDAIHVRDLGMAGADDQTILGRATDEGRIVVTQDTDFGTLLLTSVVHRPSVILLRMRDGRPETHARMLLGNLHVFEQDLLRGAIVVLSDSDIRIRRLPIE